MAKMSLEWPEQFHDFLVKQCAYFAQRICFPTGLSGSALDGEHRFNLVRLTAVDGRLAAFVVKRVDDHLEFSVAIQIKNRGNLVDIRSIGRICLRVKLAGNEFGLNIPVDYAPQDDDGITSTLLSVNWRLRERHCG